MNLAEINTYIVILVGLANVVILAPRVIGWSRRSLIACAVALMLSFLAIHTFVRIIPRSRFLRAAAAGDVQFLKTRLELDPSLIRARGKGDWTALHHAACHGKREAVQFLIGSGASMEAMGMGHTPFGLAVSRGHYDCVLLMLREGVDVNQRSMRGRATAIHIAAARGYLEIVRLLLDWGADPNLPDEYGHGTPVSDAKTEAIRRLLLDHGAK